MLVLNHTNYFITVHCLKPAAAVLTGCGGSGNYIYYEKTRVEHWKAHELGGRQQALIKDFNCLLFLL